MPAEGQVVLRDGPTTVLASSPAEVVRASGADALAVLEDLDGGWWAGFLSYDLGRSIERVRDTNPDEDGIPDLLLARFENPRRTEGISATRPGPTTSADLGAWRSSLGREEWEARVRQILDHLAAGDCYQVNLTRRLVADATPDPVALFDTLAHRNPAPHAALVCLDGIAVVSASPEEFLRRDGNRIRTRPIKGTSHDADALERSAKDRAENVMIVDLARNDLGRVCEYGSVEATAICEVEAHPGLFHLVSTVEGNLRTGTTTGDIIRATFPPASVTGCPKPRVLDIIEELEPVRRGVYCGALGFIDADNDVLDFNVAIRTFTIANGKTYFGVGGGIVADSDPRSEWDETELKARHLLAVARGQ